MSSKKTKVVKVSNLDQSESQLLLVTVSTDSKFNIVSIFKQLGVKKKSNIIYNIIATCFWLDYQESDLGLVYIVNVKLLQYLFFGIQTDDYYVALNASNVRCWASNCHLKFCKINNLTKLSINNKISKNSNFAPYRC